MDLLARPVLIVDDSPVIRTVLSDMLKRLGFTDIHTAPSARDAITRYQEVRPGLVLLDITMPEMPGTKVATHILKEDPRAKIVIVSAVSRDAELVESAISLGVYDYIRKPVRQADLQAVVARLQEEAQWDEAPPGGTLGAPGAAKVPEGSPRPHDRPT